MSLNRPDDEGTAQLLRQALADEAAGVRPDPQALQAIQQRTGPTPSHASARDSSHSARRSTAGLSRSNAGRRPPWVVGALGAGVATAAVITVVVVVSDRSGGPSGTPAAGAGHSTSASATTPRPSTATASTAPSPQPTAVTASPPPTRSTGTHVGVYDPSAPASSQVTVYYVGRDTGSKSPGTFRLYPEQHTLQSSAGSPAVAAVHEFLTSTPIDSDYSTDWPKGVDVTSITTSNGQTTIALNGSVNVGTRPDPAPFDPARPVALQALLATAGVQGQASFTYNGKPVDLLLYQGVPVQRQPDDAVRAFVSITSPVEGEIVESPVTVTGSANVFEGNLNWDLRNSAGKVVDSGYAAAGSMEWKDFSIDLGSLAAGTYTIRAYETSPKDGRPTYVDDKTFTVR
jgi:Immunoglobulin-like domain of bacterial spore germination/Sporulation and spore germination